MIHTVLAALILVQAQQASGVERGAPIQPPTPTAEALAADTGTLRHANGRTPPVAHGLRLSGAAPHVDGRLDDPIWESAAPITDLWQNEPNEGRPASERTEVRIVYDDDAIYVGARMFDREPQLIRSQLGRRDNTGNSDLFTIAFDSYLDHRTGFQFTVNPSGVRADAVANGDNSYGDDSWDPVWEVKTQRDSLGWTAEMRIPFSQLRFPPSAVQTWGVNVSRFIQRKAESSEFAWKAQTDQGYASWFGHLYGLANLPQPRRLEMLPYTTARNEMGPSTPGDPFHDGSRAFAAAGMDLKYGVTSNLTVDATINPDFGQVEQDPAYVNLSAFEQYLQERRPFFVEGANIFNFGGQQFFYSRRIGTPPHGSADSHTGFVDSPDNTTILGAAKLSGRTARGWSVGFLEALTAREYGTIDSSGTRFQDEVEPLTNYAIGRVKRDLRGGASTIGGMFTAVNRDLRDADLRFLRSAAYAGGVDFTHRFARGRYSLNGSLAGSYIRGDTLALQGAQLSSARYFQRPDAGYVEYDPTRTSLSGWSGTLGFSRLQGSLTYGVNARMVSPGMELNDAGFTTRVDQRSVNASAYRRWTRPGTVFRNANIGMNAGAGWNFGGVRTNTSGGIFGYGQFRNYWSVNGNIFVNAHALSDVLTRGGPLAVSPAGINAFVGVGTDFRKPWQVFVGSYYFTNEIGSYDAGGYAELVLRPSTSMSIDVGPSYDDSKTVQLFLTRQDDPLNTAMFGGQYVFAGIRQKSLDFTTRLNVTFSPALSLQFFVQPFIATGAYGDFKELTAPRTTDFIRYGLTPGSTLAVNRDPAGAVVSYDADPDGPGARPSVHIDNPDFSYRSLRGNAVLRWEYRPGSTAFFVWTQSCGFFSTNPRFSPGADVGRLCQGKSNNVVAIKLNYWLSL
jgi:hypothetical protein